MSRSRGFTLLEVVVALAILGMSLLAIFDLNAGAVASHVYVKELTVATMLARSKMTDLEQDLYDRGFQEDDDERSGDFGPEGWTRFQWRAQILAPRTQNTSPAQLLEAIFAIPADQGGGLAAAFGGAGKPSSTLGLGSGALPPGATGPTGLDALGPFAALAQTQMTQMLDQIRKGVRELHLTVSWKSGKRVESFDLVTHLVSLRQGSDRNGTPGLPLSQGVPGLPGQPGLPGPVPGQTPLRAVPVQPTRPGPAGGSTR